MRQVAMTVLSLMEAVERTRTSKVDIWRAIQAGTLSAKKTDEGGFAIDPADLFAVFETSSRSMFRGRGCSVVCGGVRISRNGRNL
jgi:hypothetical protein